MATLYLYNQRKRTHQLAVFSFDNALLQTRLEIREQTFRTISQELHDNLGQLLALAKLQLNSLDLAQPAAAREKITGATQLISQSIQGICDLSRSLHPDTMAALGLVRAVQTELAIIDKTGALQTAFRREVEVPSLEDRKSLILFRIVQEALHNVLKHAEATLVEVEISAAPDRLWLQQHYPDTRILVLSMNDDESSIIRMLRSGARGYILKDCEPRELFGAIHALHDKGFYHSELVSARLLHNLQGAAVPLNGTWLAQDQSTREREFLQWCCTELTYKAIADQLHLSPRAIDGYRDELFAKLGVKSRVGLAIYAIKQGLVKL